MFPLGFLFIMVPINFHVFFRLSLFSSNCDDWDDRDNFNDQSLVVQTLDSAIYWINHYPVNNN